MLEMSITHYLQIWKASGLLFHQMNIYVLKEVNIALWEIEDSIRIKEMNKEFDEQFIELARSVYYKNDVRAEIKKEINLTYNSAFVEEKEYADYKGQITK